MLPQPSRLARIGRGPARILLAAILLLLLVMALLPAPDSLPDLGRQVGFHGAIAERMRHGGEDYYSAAAAALRGSDLPLRPFTAFPLPITATVAATMPAWLALLLLCGLGVCVAAAWARCFAPSRMARDACFIVALGALVGIARADLAVLPQLWAGVFIALSLALHGGRRRIESIAIGLAAAMIHEQAALYLVVMAVMAWRDGARREMLAWIVTLGPVMMVVALHASAAAGGMGPLDTAPEWWGAGLAGAFAALASATGASMLPLEFATPLLVIGIIGWSAWLHPVAARAGATAIAYLVLLALLPAAQVASAFLAAPLVLLGLLPAIDGARDLIRAALDSRRITVTRVVR